MRTSPRLRAGAAGLFLLGAAWAASAQQQQSPESILPPGFGDQPVPAGSPSPRATQPLPSATQPLDLPPPGATDLAGASPSPTPTATVDPTELRRIMADYELPAFARRSLASTGAIGTSEGGLPGDAFGNADGGTIEALMRTLDTPIASRWLEIALRRTLLSDLQTPAGLNGADYAAERAWLLLRLGESVAARSVVQSVDAENYTPKLYQVAMQAALATSDPAGLCPLADGALPATGEPGWVMAKAMCAALAGNQADAAAQITAARRHGVAGGVDLLLAQKVAGAGAGGRQAVTIEWDGVDQLTAWRFGLATSTGVAVPDELYETVAPQVAAWRALSPALSLADRAGVAERAASWGILSNAAMVDLYGAIDAADDQPSALAGTASDLRAAYTDPSASDRLAAIRRLWGQDTVTPYGRLVLTARAAARVAPANDNAEADRLIAAMLSAGLTPAALRWSGHVADGGDGWAMLRLAQPEPAAPVSYRDLSGYAGAGDAAIKQRLLFAGLAGLGRMADDDVTRAAEALAVPIGRQNPWTRAIDRAAEQRQPGMVVLLAAVGMQTRSWRGVPPDALFHIVSALRRVGLDGEARMIAAEAIARA